MPRKINSLALLLAFLCSLFFPVPAKAQGIAAAADFTFADLGESDMTVRTIYEQAFVDFPIAEGRQVSRVILRLHMQHAPDLLPDLSDIVIALNDEPVTDVILSPDNAADGVTEIELPVAVLQPGQNELLLRFSLRLVENGCTDVNDPNLWVTVFADSSISIETQETQEPVDLSQFPLPFSTFSALPASPQISFVLPALPNPAELSAAAQIAASLGQAANWKNPPLSAFSYDQLDQARLQSDALIVIDSGGRNPLAVGGLPGLTVLPSPYDANQLMLVVSGADESELLRSAAMLTTRSAHNLLAGNHVDSAVVTPQALPAKPSRSTFSELGLLTRRVRGIGLHDLYYPIDVPYDWKTTSEAAVEVRFTHGAAITSASLMTTFINGFETANVRLDPRNDDDGRLVIQLSPRQIHPGRNWLHIVFDLHMPRENCKFRYFEEAWAEVSAQQSLINLAHVVSVAPLDISYLPSYLIIPEDLSLDLLVLPDVVTNTDLTALVKIAAKLGSYSSADAVLIRATSAGQFVQPTDQSYVILLGTPESNSLIKIYDSTLPQPLTRVNGAVLPSGGRTLSPEELTGQAAYLEILPAPWSRFAPLLIISANDPGMLSLAVDALPTGGRRMSQKGNLAVVTLNGVTGYSAGDAAGASLSASARNVISSVLTGAFILMVLLGLVFRNRRRKSKGRE